MQKILWTLVLVSPLAHADPNYWICYATDGHHTWSSPSSEQRSAINNAYDACKKTSDDPAKCSTDKENCDYYMYGKSAKPLWECYALDHNSRRWKNSPRTTRNSAALASKAKCQNHSSFPDSCYMVLWTCKDLNDYL